MKKFFLALLAMAVALAITPAAKADTTFYFDYSVAGVNSSGTLVGTELGDTGSYQITSGTITSTSGWGTYSGTIDTNSGDLSKWGFDNVLYFNPQIDGNYLDNDGLLFNMSSGEEGGFNGIWSSEDPSSSADYSIWIWDMADVDGGGTMTVSLTPEPSSLLLLGTGLLGLAFVAFRKAKASRLTLSV